MRLFLFLLLTVSSAQAQPKLDDVPDTRIDNNSPGIHALPTEKLEAIRQIGRHVLMAKKSGREEPVNTEQLSQLRAAVDNLIAAEDSSKPNGIKLEKQASAASSGIQPDQDEPQRKAARTRGLDVVAKLRQEASQLQSKTKTSTKIEVYSGGYPIGQNRGRLFEKWADKLEATITDSNANRIDQLRRLREQLNAKKNSVTDVPIEHETPTAQAIPWKKPLAPTKKTQRKTKSRK